jgi:hypothetical protein
MSSKAGRSGGQAAAGRLQGCFAGGLQQQARGMHAVHWHLHGAYMWMGLPPVAMAASLMASLRVGCPWQVRAMSCGGDRSA